MNLLTTEETGSKRGVPVSHSAPQDPASAGRRTRSPGWALVWAAGDCSCVWCQPGWVVPRGGKDKTRGCIRSNSGALCCWGRQSWSADQERTWFTVLTDERNRYEQEHTGKTIWMIFFSVKQCLSPTHLQETETAPLCLLISSNQLSGHRQLINTNWRTSTFITASQMSCPHTYKITRF